MADREYTISVIKRLHEKPSDEVLKKFNNDNAGIGCMLKYLSDIDRPVSAGEISEFMNVSTARVSVLLKKMQEKNFIIRAICSEDARKLMISLSDGGRAECNRRQEKLIRTFSRIIDEVGMESMEEFISVAQKIKVVVTEEMKKFNVD